MELARRAPMLALVMLMLCAAASAQTLRSENDPRNTAPTVGTGGPVGGPTGLFTVYDGQTLRRGEFTFSAAYSNFDRDPGNVDITEVPVSFQVGLGDYLELFFNTDAYRQIKVNSPQNLSGFGLPNARNFAAGNLVLGPNDSGASGIAGGVFFVPARTATGNGQAFTQFPFVGAAGPRTTGGGRTFGTLSGNISPGRGDGFIDRNFGAADQFPGIGSPLGGILPGIVLTTTLLPRTDNTSLLIPNSSFDAPSYLPDAPFLGRTYGQTSFNTFTVGAKFRLTDVKNPFGVALIPFYRFYSETGDDFNQLQRGASPAGNIGDFGLVLAVDGRLSRSVNVSANLGYVLNSNPRGTFGSQELTMLDRPDEIMGAIGFDFPVNRFFQPIAELRTNHYVGGRTTNALENYPIDGLVGVRIFPRRFFGFSAAYRRHFNQQDGDFAGGDNGSGGIAGFTPSDDPNGFIGQFFIGRRNLRAPEFLPNQPPVVNVTASGGTATTDGGTSIVVCPRDPSLATPPNSQVQITTTASDPDGDTLLYTYETTGGRIIGEGPNVTLDLSGVAPGTYTVNATVDDGCGCVAFDSTTVTVTECAIPEPPPCPTVTVSCPDTVEVGSPATFTANVNGGDTNVTPTYNWTVTIGTITSGQGTPNITVDTTGFAGQAITATVTVGGFDPSCQNTASCTTSATGPTEVPNRKFSEYGDILDDEAKAQLDLYAVELQNDPGATATIITYANRNGTDRRRRNAQRRADFARDYLVNNRGIDAGRIQTIDGGFREEAATELYIVPTGATQPTASPTVDASEVTPPRRPARRRGRRR